MNPKPDLSRRITTDLASLHKQHTTSHIKNPSPIGVGGDDNNQDDFYSAIIIYGNSIC